MLYNGGKITGIGMSFLPDFSQVINPDSIEFVLLIFYLYANTLKL